MGTKIYLSKKKYIYPFADIFFSRQIIRLHKQVPKKQRTRVHRTYTTSIKRHKKERTQKMTPSLSKNLTNEQNQLKVKNLLLCTTSPTRKDYQRENFSK